MEIDLDGKRATRPQFASFSECLPKTSDQARVRQFFQMIAENKRLGQSSPVFQNICRKPVTRPESASFSKYLLKTSD